MTVFAERRLDCDQLDERGFGILFQSLFSLETVVLWGLFAGAAGF
ncbi:hypothetical protein [Cytobacillus firmus]|nr:hypothetical protein [Cytobacillus firmus]